MRRVWKRYAARGRPVLQLAWGLLANWVGLRVHVPTAHPSVKLVYLKNRARAGSTAILDSFPRRESLILEATQVRNVSGVWPISFSYPFEESPKRNSSETRDLVSSIVPGARYSFVNEKEYLRTYGRSHLALSHKKGGWDCLRHLEIIAAGCVPLFPESEDIPSETMFFYPKHFFGLVWQEFLRTGRHPDNKTKDALWVFAQENLSTMKMSQYVLDATEASSSRVLFVDENLPLKADYLSVMTLIGLKQLFGASVEVAFPVPYVYSNYSGSTLGLYGRGFGYCAKLDSKMQSQGERKGIIPEFSRAYLQSFDLVVVGSVMRNVRSLPEVLRYVPSEKIALLHGEDVGPSRAELNVLRDTNCHVFVRELDSRPSG